jgi:hypothetical protein
MAFEIIKNVYRTSQHGTYVVSLPIAWIKMNGIELKKKVRMIIENNKITIMPVESEEEIRNK